MTWERARSEEQIEHRIKEITDATARLYETNRFEDITFSMIAREASFTRSNLYRYFKTKEEIFLALLSHDMVAWREEVVARFTEKDISVSAFAEQWVDLALKNQRLIEIYTILYTMLEPNASLEALTTFKQNTLVTFGMIVEKLKQVFPALSPETAIEFLFSFISLGVGMYPMMNLTEKQHLAMENVDMVFASEYYKAIFIKSVRLILQGLIEEK
jgi:AcrR family transcriptional regulator